MSEETRPDRLSPSDFRLLQTAYGTAEAAQLQLKQAQAHVALVQQHLAREYDFQEGDSVGPEGRIARAPSKAAPSA